MTIISNLSDYVKGKLKDFEGSLAFLPDSVIDDRVFQFTAKKTERSQDNSITIPPDKNEVVKNIDDEPVQIDADAINSILIEKEELEQKQKKSNLITSTIKNRNRMYLTNENDKIIFNEIEEIILTFCQNFPKYSKQEIVDSLKNNSFNIENTYFPHSLY